jgi:hypothetical protein
MNKELELALFNKYIHHYITIDCDELCNNYFDSDVGIRVYLRNIIKHESDRYMITLTKNTHKITFNMNNIDNVINTIINYYKIIHIF